MIIENNLLRQISSLNQELVEENNKMAKVLMKVMYSKQNKGLYNSSNLIQTIKQHDKELRNYSQSSIKSNKSKRGKSVDRDSFNNIGKSKKRYDSCYKSNKSNGKELKQSQKSRLLLIRSHTNPVGRPTYPCEKQSNLTKIKKLSMKMFPKVSNQFLFKNRSKALNIAV